MTNRRKRRRYTRLVNSRLNRKSYLKRRENKKKFVLETLKRLAPFSVAVMSTAFVMGCSMIPYSGYKHRFGSSLKDYN